MLISRGLEGGVGEGTGFAYWLGENELICSILGASTGLFEFGFVLILFIHAVRLRAIFLLGVTGFHVGNYFLADVKFLFIPVFFLLFFDVSSPVRAWLGQRRERAAGS